MKLRSAARTSAIALLGSVPYWLAFITGLMAPRLAGRPWAQAVLVVTSLFLFLVLSALNKRADAVRVRRRIDKHGRSP